MSDAMEKLLETAQMLEAWAGAFLASGIGCCLWTVWLISLEPAFLAGQNEGGFVLFVVAASMLLEGPFLFRLWSTVLREEFPLGPRLAEKCHYRFVAWRVVATVWWSIHFLLGIVMIAVLHHGQGGRIPVLAAVGLSIAASIASNVYLGLLIKAATNDDQIVRTVWSYRLAVDLVLSTASLLAAALF